MRLLVVAVKSDVLVFVLVVVVEEVVVVRESEGLDSGSAGCG
jgi:hypothetical protein